MAEGIDLKNLNNNKSDSDPGFDQYKPPYKTDLPNSLLKDENEFLSKKEKDDIINQLLEKYGAKAKLNNTPGATDSLGSSLNSYSTNLDASLRKSQLINHIHAINEPKAELATSQYLPPYQNWSERFEFDKYPPFQAPTSDNNLYTNSLQNGLSNSQNSSPPKIWTSTTPLPTTNLVYERNPLVEQIIKEEKEKKQLAELKTSSFFSESKNTSPISEARENRYQEQRESKFQDPIEKKDFNIVKQRILAQVDTIINKEPLIKNLTKPENPNFAKSLSKENVVPPAGKNGFKIVGVLMLILIFRLFIILYLDI